jgi:hypothetical protein
MTAMAITTDAIEHWPLINRRPDGITAMLEGVNPGREGARSHGILLAYPPAARTA